MFLIRDTMNAKLTIPTTKPPNMARAGPQRAGAFFLT
jgi:hypothetical protein